MTAVTFLLLLFLAHTVDKQSTPNGQAGKARLRCCGPPCMYAEARIFDHMTSGSQKNNQLLKPASVQLPFIFYVYCSQEFSQPVFSYRSYFTYTVARNSASQCSATGHILRILQPGIQPASVQLPFIFYAYCSQEFSQPVFSYCSYFMHTVARNSASYSASFKVQKLSELRETAGVQTSSWDWEVPPRQLREDTAGIKGHFMQTVDRYSAINQFKDCSGQGRKHTT